MGFFKKKKQAPAAAYTFASGLDQNKVNSCGESLDRLVNGDLPFGWIAHNKAFTDKLEKELSYFNKQVWKAEDDGNPIARRNALKSLVQYMEDAQKLCDSKGECFSLWCSDILIGNGFKKNIASKLTTLEKNMDQEMERYQAKQKESEFAAALTDDIIIEAIKQNPDILQKDFYDVFDPAYKNVISEKLYFMTKEGKIERIKSGNSYILKIK
ncbi:MAG: hypothetical protein IKW21_01205 [Lachnospiraceae bacterium]|nr:hypothetical protein [Lachnospiraceae bacterium]